MRESPKRIISVNGGLELLQMVLELDIGRCASKDAVPQRGWTSVCQQGRWASKGVWVVISHIDWRGE